MNARVAVTTQMAGVDLLNQRRAAFVIDQFQPVSYTHLTLPTIYSV